MQVNIYLFEKNCCLFGDDFGVNNEKLETYKQTYSCL